MTINDGPTPAIVVSESTLTVTEGTSLTTTYTVTLSVQPTSGVDVRVTRSAANYVLNKAGGTQGGEPGPDAHDGELEHGPGDHGHRAQ